jgi:hypothetical protein
MGRNVHRQHVRDYVRRGIVTLMALFAGASPYTHGATSARPLSERPFSFDSTPGRLPKNVVPEHYDVAVTPDIKTLSFAGHESITLQMLTSTDRIQFPQRNLDGRATRRPAGRHCHLGR